ncbi:MAG: hypothetical protein U0798_19440 [Gemmataceae bacterium]
MLLIRKSTLNLTTLDERLVPTASPNPTVDNSYSSVIQAASVVGTPIPITVDTGSQTIYTMSVQPTFCMCAACVASRARIAAELAKYDQPKYEIANATPSTLNTKSPSSDNVTSISSDSNSQSQPSDQSTNLISLTTSKTTENTQSIGAFFAKADVPATFADDQLSQVLQK